MKQIKFFSTIPGVADAFPILESKNSMPSWMQAARLDYMKQNKRDLTILRCPGVVDLLTTGYIVTAWHDIDVEVQPHKFSVTIPDQSLNDMLEKDSIQVQTPDGLAKHIPKRPWSQKAILKINTPWNLMAPKGLKFMMIPLPYTESFEFEAAPGILDPGYSTELNVQGYVNVPAGTTLTIKAGTPLAQLVPMSNEQYEFVCRDMTEEDKTWAVKRKFLNKFAFIFQRNTVKESYEKHNTGKCPFHFWGK
jgi:hypothetical protein